MIEVLEETVKFYTDNPSRRAVFHHNCMYLSPDGKRCAVGRLIPPDYDNIIKNCSDLDVYNLFYKHEQIEEAIGLPVGFLHDLQRIHDSSKYWTGTEEAKNALIAQVEAIKKEIKLTSYRQP